MKIQTWLKKAIILGAVFFIAALIIKPVGVSTQFSVLSGIIHSAADSDLIEQDETSPSGYVSSNEYYNKNDGKLAKAIKNPLNYDFIFVLAIPLGSVIGYLFMNYKGKRQNNSDKAIAQTDSTECNYEINKKSMWRSYIVSFVGGFLLLYGARMADGCTSGHMMSGMMQGSVSGYIFAAAVFAVAIPTAIIISKLTGRVAKGGKK